MCTALYVGSFDPFTNGHLNVLDHAAKLFDRVYICVMTNPKKKRFVSVDVSESMIKQIIQDRYSNVELVVPTTNLAYKQAKEYNCDYLVRGVRNNGVDYSFEESYAEFNKEVGGVNTIFIRADVHKNISSTMIKALFDSGEDIGNYIPRQALQILMEAIK